jgi:putative multicomponent Na+:H+ antiporter subunit B
MEAILNTLQILLIIIALAIVISNNNRTLVIFLAVFSLFSASLYYFNHAPDVALAEVAIGSAIMPLIYIISIAKQREFIVVDHTEDSYFSYNGEGYHLLKAFTHHYKLKLIITTKIKGNVTGIFRRSNIDLVIDKTEDSIYELKGNKTSILLNKLEAMTNTHNQIRIVRLKAGETDD